MMFVYFSMVFFTYFLSSLIALFLEYPFRTMSKVVFSPPKKVLRLNRELAKELNTNFIDDMFNEDDNDTIGGGVEKTEGGAAEVGEYDDNFEDYDDQND
jgi:hypothetical protein